jgi:hypothetical protein
MYALNPQAARQADERIGRIDERGAYKGEFKRAEDITSKNGARGIDFDFETASRQVATATIWTMDRQGKPIDGNMKLVSALLTCMGLRNIEPSQIKVTKFNRDVGQRQEMLVEGFPELMKKPIGVLFDTEEYQKNDGSVGIRANFAGFFRAADDMMAGEILDKKTTAAQLQKFIPTLRHKALKPTGQSLPHWHSMAGGFDTMADDIPF